MGKIGTISKIVLFFEFFGYTICIDDESEVWSFRRSDFDICFTLPEELFEI